MRDRLQRRARLVATIREFLDGNGAIEVMTPVIIGAASAEPAIANLALDRQTRPRYLRTSPEAHLKVMLSLGAGDIYEIGPVFRADELGRHHAEEFTLLEWYRLGFDHRRLMDEVAALVETCGLTCPLVSMSYSELFRDCFGCEVHGIEDAALERLALEHGLGRCEDKIDRAGVLDGLYAAVLENELATRGAVLLFDYPLELRAYARLTETRVPVAERFELVINGLEIANGYHEVIDAAEQQRCFDAENALRRERGLAAVEPDRGWIDALERGVPACAGVALGIERLIMALDGLPHIDSARPGNNSPQCPGERLE